MKDKIIGLLQEHPGEFVSGQYLCEYLGVSRTAVWKHIQQLATYGYLIEAYPQKGYRLVKGTNLFLPWEIKKDLQTQLLGKNIYHLFRTESTNDWAKEQARKGAHEGSVFIAQEQTKGRGRRGRTWLSPQGGLYFSIILRPPILPRFAPQIGIVTAVGLAQALKSAGIPISLKWPNDLLIHGKKLAGILMEMSGELDRLNYIIVGIGLNLTGKTPLPTGITAAHYIANLHGITLLKSILEKLEESYLKYLQKGFDPIRQEYMRDCTTLHQQVDIHTSGGNFSAFARDISQDGGLVIDYQGKEEILYAGDVSVKTR